MYRMTTDDFASLANYINIAWRGFFSEEEVEEFIDTYVTEYNHMWSDNTYVSDVLLGIADGLYEDIQNGAEADNEDVILWWECLNDIITHNTFAD